MAFDRVGRARLVLSTAPAHRVSRFRRGSLARTVRREYAGRRRLSRGTSVLTHLARRSRIVFGVGRGRVRFVAVADPRLKRRVGTLHAYVRLLRRAGVRF